MSRHDDDNGGMWWIALAIFLLLTFAVKVAISAPPRPPAFLEPAPHAQVYKKKGLFRFNGFGFGGADQEIPIDKRFKALRGIDSRFLPTMDAVSRRVKVLPYAGPRSVTQQWKHYTDGKSKTMNSYHLVGCALDSTFYKKNGELEWSYSDVQRLSNFIKGVAWGQGLHLIAGDDWNDDFDDDDTSFPDAVHLQIKDCKRPSDSWIIAKARKEGLSIKRMSNGRWARK